MQRVWEELDAFEERDMHDVLRYMIYPVDFMRENKIRGVGRGPSVASYVLYLIGVHLSIPIPIWTGLERVLKISKGIKEIDYGYETTRS